MFRTQVEKFYSLIFSDDEQEEKIPYANKAFMFYFSIITFVIAAILIGKDIADNINGV